LARETSSSPKSNRATGAADVAAASDAPTNNARNNFVMSGGEGNANRIGSIPERNQSGLPHETKRIYPRAASRKASRARKWHPDNSDTRRPGSMKNRPLAGYALSAPHYR
jgi:hypothetical protein